MGHLRLPKWAKSYCQTHSTLNSLDSTAFRTLIQLGSSGFLPTVISLTLDKLVPVEDLCRESVQRGKRNRSNPNLVAVLSAALSMLKLAYKLLSIGLLCASCTNAQLGSTGSNPSLSGWRTNIAKHSIDLSEIEKGGPPKDGIPAIDRPQFVSVVEARQWLHEREPVIALAVNGEARAYPLQILVWHEIVNDEVKGLPVTVTFCPLCYSAIAFDRRIEGQTLTFGVTGLLRRSDMVMFDRATESWWQQFTGEAIVGDLTGTKLQQLPAQIIGFAQFAVAHPDGLVLSRETGFKREYGKNPYAGYDDTNSSPILYRGKTDHRLRPMEKVVAVQIDQLAKAYPYSITRKLHVVQDQVGLIDLVVFHGEGASSALDSIAMSESREVGATGVFDSRVDGHLLHFRYETKEFLDTETGSHWNILGRAISGPLRGKQLDPIVHGDYFAFAWLAFRPDTEIFRR